VATSTAQLDSIFFRLDFNGDNKREYLLKPLCLEVLKRFEFLSQRVDCYFASSDDDYLTTQNGCHFRGFQISYLGRNDLPRYLFSRFFHAYDGRDPLPSFEQQLAFDHLIYVRNSTSLDPTGCTSTLAHELEHIAQHCQSHSMMRANNLLYDNVIIMSGGSDFTVFDIPTERDANIVSKRVAETICGPEAVMRFTDERIQYFAQLARSGDDAAGRERTRWEGFRNISPEAGYDWIEATKVLIERFRPEIVTRNLGRFYGLDFTKAEWW